MAEIPDTNRTGRLYLEPLTVEKHGQDFHEIWSDDLVTEWLGRPSTRNLEESKAFLTSVLPTAANPDIEKFAIMLKDQNVMVGFAGTNRLGPQGMETGYCVKRKYWGMGYASEGFGLFLDMYWGLEERKNINRLVAKTVSHNTASQKVLQKCGAKKGEVLEKVVPRPGDVGEKMDLWCWYLERPVKETEIKG